MVSPLLVIRRIVVAGELSCDLQFDRGLNIVQAVQTDDDPKSTNKVGKTSLVELIQHGLGRRQKSKAKYHFAPIIDRLDTLWLEVNANDEIFTIERSLRQINARARVHEGPYVPGIEDAPAELVDIEEMSSLFLRALAIPEVSAKTAKGDLFPLSFPTLMRAFVLHQEDSFGAILDKMQPEQRRTDVIGFLSHITPVERFTVEDKLSEVQLEIQRLENYFDSVQTFLLENDVPSMIEAQARVRAAEEKLERITAEQRSIQREVREATSTQSPGQSGWTDELRQRLFAVKEEAAHIERNVYSLQQEEKRLNEVLASLKVDRKKAKRVRASSTILNSIEFNICPRCLQEITSEMQRREQYTRCSLCNRPLRITSDAPPRTIPKTQDIDLQIEETETILRDICQEREEVQAKLEELRAQEIEVGQRLDSEAQAYISPVVDRILSRAHELGQIEAELAHAKMLLGQARALDAIRDQLNHLKQEQAVLEDQLREARQPYKARLEALRQIYENILRTVDFPNIQTVSINSQSFMPNINGNLYTHVGTALTGLATVSYHLALLELSQRETTFFPRMLVIDSPAVGDLNEENHDRLLQYLATLQIREKQSNTSQEDAIDWQIILTTRRLIPELRSYVREEISAPNRMLLRDLATGNLNK